MQAVLSVLCNLKHLETRGIWIRTTFCSSCSRVINLTPTYISDLTLREHLRKREAAATKAHTVFAGV